MTGRAEVDRLKQRLDATFKRSQHLVIDPEGQADLARYLVILVSGYLEKSITELLVEHARRSGGPTLQRYVDHQTRRFTNPNAQRLIDLLGTFHPDWRRHLNKILVDEHKAAVDSVVALRNDIAHGGQPSVTFQRINEYYRRVQQVIEEIANLCVP